MNSSNKKTVKMSFKPLYSYVMCTNYRNFSGILSLIISVAAFVIFLLFQDKLSNGYKVLLIAVALLFTVINPLMLAFKTFKQLKLSPSYRKPLDYTFDDEGILVEQGELSQRIEWKHICRLLKSNKMIAVYTSRIHAFVIPLAELGEDKGKIITMMVQYTADNNPVLSSNLREYRSGKGYKGN